MKSIIETAIGFPPVYDENSKILVLGSFPSVKSREISFYYGNKQNRFWNMIFSYFGEERKDSVAEKVEFLHRHGIALWDIVSKCTVCGSSDSSICETEVADLSCIFKTAHLSVILLNGAKANEIFEENYKQCSVPHYKMPSTSPANPRYQEKKWRDILDEIFRTTL